MPDLNPDFGDRVTYVDGEGEEHRALIVASVPDEEYVTLVTGANAEFGEGYNWGVDAHTSIYPHADLGAEFTATKHAYKPGWDSPGGDP